MIKHLRLTVVRAKEIAGEQNPVLPQVGEHGIRPVQKRRADKCERLSAKIERIAVFYDRNVHIRTVGDIF